MHDLKLALLLELLPDTGQTFGHVPMDEAVLGSPACKRVLGQFRTNIALASRISEAPLFSAFTSVLHQTAMKQSLKYLYPEATPIQIEGEALAALNERTHQRFIELLNADNVDGRALMGGIILGLSSHIQFIDRPGQHVSMHSVFEGLLKSTLIQAWTAFEVLAGDLWERAVNEHPVRLAELSAITEKTEKQVQLWLLAKHGYNLSAVMGTVLKTKFNFRVFDGIKDAYKQAFTTNNDAIIAALDAPPLKALSLMRNLLVHSGGVVDAVFMKDSRGVSGLESIRLAGEGTAVPFDAEIVRAYVISTITASCELIEAVDEWLTNN